MLTKRKLDQFIQAHPQTHPQAYPQAHSQAYLQAVEYRLISTEKQASCIKCRVDRVYAKKRKFGDEIPINQVQKRSPRTNFICNVCNVPLCKEKSCWEEHHRTKGII